MANLTFMGLCIIIYFNGETNQTHQYLKFILSSKYSTRFGRSLRPSSVVHDRTYSGRHVLNRYCYLLASGSEMEFHLISASSSVHQQEFFTLHTADLCDIYCCCVYSEGLLITKGGTVRNMLSFIPKKINL